MQYQDWTGRTIDEFRLEEQIGSGGMGTVYRAQQTNLERDVAVKVLAYTADRVAAERFYREARTIAKLEHPHIVPIYDYGTRDDVSFIAMRLLTGGSLDDLLSKNNKGLPLADVGRIAGQLGGALRYAHERGVVHRDIKGSNVLFDPTGSAYLVDFGIAKMLQGTDSALTAEHIVMGTPTYMSPEIWQGAPFTPAADQYALAVLVYKMLTGMPPFMAASSYALMELHLNHPVADIHTVRPELPPQVSPVLHKALAKQPDQRYATVQQFTDTLRAALRGEVLQPNNPPASRPMIEEPPIEDGATVRSKAASSEVTQPHQVYDNKRPQPSSIPSPRPKNQPRTPPPPQQRRVIHPPAQQRPPYAPQQRAQPPHNPYARPQRPPQQPRPQQSPPWQRSQQQVVRERVIIREGQRTSPLWIVTWPFRFVWRILSAIAGFIGSLVATIIQQMLRSVVAFVMWLVLILGTLTFVIAFVVALVVADFDVSAAFALLVEQLTRIVQGFLPS